MKHSFLSAAAALASLALVGAAAAQPAGADAVRQACAADFQKLCPDAKPGDGSLRACARAHFTEFTGACRQAMLQMRQAMQSGQSEPPKHN